MTLAGGGLPPSANPHDDPPQPQHSQLDLADRMTFSTFWIYQTTQNEIPVTQSLSQDIRLATSAHPLASVTQETHTGTPEEFTAG